MGANGRQALSSISQTSTCQSTQSLSHADTQSSIGTPKSIQQYNYPTLACYPVQACMSLPSPPLTCCNPWCDDFAWVASNTALVPILGLRTAHPSMHGSNT